MEEKVVVDTLPIFEKAKLDLAGISFFIEFNSFTIFSNSIDKQVVSAEKLKTPNNISRVFNVDGFLKDSKETF